MRPTPSLLRLPITARDGSSCTFRRRPSPVLFAFASASAFTSSCHSYHLTFSNNGLEQASDQHHLSFEETRRRSPLFLATIISIGARSLSRFDTFHTTYREAVRLAHDSFIPSATAEGQADPSAPPAGDSVLPSFARSGAHSVDDANTNSILEFRLPTLTLKALILLGLYHSMPELLVHAWMAGYRFIQPQASQAFYEMTPEERSSPKARGIVNHTRVGLVAWLWLSLCVSYPSSSTPRRCAMTDAVPTLQLHLLPRPPRRHLAREHRPAQAARDATAVGVRRATDRRRHPHQL